MADADLVRDGVGGRIPPAPPSPPTATPVAEDETAMSLVDHLSELRRRVGISLLAVVLGSAVGFYFAPQLILFLKAPLNLGKPLVYTGLGDAFFINLKLSIVVGSCWRCPSCWSSGHSPPGLTRSERRMARPWVPPGAGVFVIGVVVAYVILPFASSFLLSFSSADLQPLITASEYFGFVTTLFLVFGLVMEYPIVLVLLAKVGILTSTRLRSSRRVVILAIAIISAVATPGGDPISPTVLGVTMYLLFEFSIVMIRMGGR